MSMERAETPQANVKPMAGTFFDQLRSKVETKTGRISAAVAIVIGAATLSACSARGEAAPQPVASHAAEVTPAPTPEATETAEPNTGEFVGGVLEQDKTVEQMDSMSLDDYAKLPFADRLAYGIAKNEGAYPVSDVVNDPIKTTPELIAGYFWQGGQNYATSDANPDTRAKLAGSFIYYTTDKPDGEMAAKYIESSSEVVQKGGEGIGADYNILTTDHGQLQHGKDRDGKPIDFLNITYKDGPSATVDTATEKTTQAIRTEVKLLDGKTVVFYALGYTTDGHASPVEDYPY